MDQFFFQNPNYSFISEHFGASFTKPNNPLQKYWQFDILEHYDVPGTPDHYQEKYHDQIAATMDILLHVCKTQTFYLE